MKTMKTISFLGIGVLVMLQLASCSSGNGVNPIKSAELNISASSVSSSSSSSGRISQNAAVDEFLINIGDITIEENSGNDQGGDHQDKNSNDNESDNEGPETEDILLNGPFLLDLSKGSAPIDQVAVYPGTFKKVDFSFVPDASLGGHSIVLKGTIDQNGMTVPYTINSNIDLMIQIALPNGGIVVTDSNTATLNIILDADTLLSEVSFADAQSTSGEIIIDQDNNSSLLVQFESALSKLVEVED